jgi:hypothetical protein
MTAAVDVAASAQDEIARHDVDPGGARARWVNGKAEVNFEGAAVVVPKLTVY